MRLSTRLEKQVPQPGTPIRVVVAYHDDAAFHAAQDVYRAMIQRLAADFEFRSVWLPFGAFTEPLSLERAVDATIEADIVVCCPNNAYLLPGTVQNWIRLWLARRSEPDCVLAVLLPVTVGMPSHQTPVVRDLWATARAAGLAFFFKEYAIEQARDSQSLLVQTLIARERSSDRTAVLPVHDSVRHWGINE